jgi:TolB-like protein
MGEGDGTEKSSEVGAQPPGASAGATSRPVFISYASADASTAQKVCAALEAAGFPCWFAPRNVIPGTMYADGIVHAIDESSILVLILSGQAVASAHVGREVERAVSKRHPVVALRIDAAPLTPAFEYFLNQSQWIEGGGNETAIAQLVSAVGQHLAPGSAASPTNANQVSAVHRKAATPRRAWGIAAVVVAVALAGAYFLVDKGWLSKHGTTASSAVSGDKSIAVLPFLDMSEKHDQEYFADGMAEEIIDLLAKVPDLRVPARTSSFYFKGKSIKVSEIARELGVAQVLEGSIRRSADRIRVTAQLVRADNGFHLWSETYDRDLSDVFKVQDDIANAVVQALQISLMGGPLTRQKGGTQNLEAYQLYLKSRSSTYQNSKPSLEAADGYLDQAIKLDPNFANAWYWKAIVVMQQIELGVLPPRDFEHSRQLAQHALLLSPDFARPHFILAYIHRTYDFDWPAAHAELRKGSGTDPMDVDGLIVAGELSKTLGHWEEAERQLRSVLVLDPLATYAHYNLGATLYLAGRFADAEAVFRRLQELAPGFSWTRWYLAKTLLAEGKPDAALALVQQEDHEEYRLSVLPIILQAVGRNAEADEALKLLTTKYAESEAYSLATIYAYRNESDLALQWLDRAYQQRDLDLLEIVGEPLFKNIVSDPRYKAFLKKMNLPDE